MSLENLFLNFSLSRNLDLSESDEDRQARFKQECKSTIGNKQDTPKFKEKLNACMDKKNAKHAKRVAKAEAAADRAEMKQKVKAKKAEKVPIKVTKIFFNPLFFIFIF